MAEAAYEIHRQDLPIDVRFQGMIAAMQPAIDANANLSAYLAFVQERIARFTSDGYMCDYAIDIADLLRKDATEAFVVAMPPDYNGSVLYDKGYNFPARFTNYLSYTDIYLVKDGEMTAIPFERIIPIVREF